MNELTVTINQTNLTVKEHDGRRVVTLKEIDEVHQRPQGTARKRFNDNKAHFIEGTDYYKISASDFRTRFQPGLSKQVTEDITLITESGYLMLVKSFTDDVAWDVQRKLVDTYFRAKATAAPQRSLAEINAAALLIIQTLKEAGVAPEHRLMTLKGLYETVGVEIPLAGLSTKRTTYDTMSIAAMLGIYSKNSRPHKQAVAEIISRIDVLNSEKAPEPFSKQWQYTESVVEKVRLWVQKNGYPAEIEGLGMVYKVFYKN